MPKSQQKGLPPSLHELNIPLTWLAGPRRKVTISIPRNINQKLTQLSEEYGVDKSKLYTISMALLLQRLGVNLD